MRGLVPGTITDLPIPSRCELVAYTTSDTKREEKPIPDETPLGRASAHAEVVATRENLDATEEELNNYKLKLAAFDNARKRLVRDAEIKRKYATEPLVRDLLGALDNLDRALEAARRAGDTGPLAAGVQAT